LILYHTDDSVIGVHQIMIEEQQLTDGVVSTFNDLPESPWPVTVSGSLTEGCFLASLLTHEKEQH